MKSSPPVGRTIGTLHYSAMHCWHCCSTSLNYCCTFLHFFTIIGTVVAHPFTIVAHFCTFFYHYWHCCSTSLHYCSTFLHFFLPLLALLGHISYSIVAYLYTVPLLALLWHSFSIVLKVVHWKFPLQKKYCSFEVDLDFDLSQNNIFSTIM